jgi:hypothetical protein
MAFGLDDTVQTVPFAMAHMRNVHRRQRIVGQDRQHRAGQRPGQRLPRQQGGQRAFQSAQIDRIIHRRQP